MKKITTIDPGVHSFVKPKRKVAAYVRVSTSNGTTEVTDQCVSRLERKTHLCTSETIREDELHQAINEVLRKKGDYLNLLLENIKTVLNENADKLQPILMKS